MVETQSRPNYVAGGLTRDVMNFEVFSKGKLKVSITLIKYKSYQNEQGRAETSR